MQTRSKRLLFLLVHFLLNSTNYTFKLKLEEGNKRGRVWLVDDSDGKCLGANGFIECGDATLMKIHPNHNQSEKSKSSNLLNGQQAIQLFDIGSCLYHGPRINNKRTKSSKQRAIVQDNVDSPSPSDSINDQNVLQKSLQQFELKANKCTAKKAQIWNLSDIVYTYLPINTIHSVFSGNEMVPYCISRLEDRAVLHPIQKISGDGSSSSSIKSWKELDESLTDPSCVRLRFLSYDADDYLQPVAIDDDPFFDSEWSGWMKGSSPSLLAHSFQRKSNDELTDAKKKRKTWPWKRKREDEAEEDEGILPDYVEVDRSHNFMSVALKPSLSHFDDYFGKDNKAYIDADTDLIYPLYLDSYLDHKEGKNGDYLLTGMGQYTRTVFKVKIYGVALYVHVPTILEESHKWTDLVFMSKDELIEDGGVHRLLMEKGNVDQTLFLKLNMQLSFETMQSSLQADWQNLTPEHKKQILDASFLPRLADQRMLNLISDSEANPSRCSCGQVAPKTYEADPSCCARGTELVFTWRKDGRLEIRLDGRLMESFEDPAMAGGIFFEYLRDDDPMSVEARENVIHGFPHIFGSIAAKRQQHLTTGVSGKGKKSTKRHTSEHLSTLIHRSISNMSGFFTDRAHDMHGWMESNIEGAVDHLTSTGRWVGSGFHNALDEINYRREVALSTAHSFVSGGMHTVLNNIPFIPEEMKNHVKDNYIPINRDSTANFLDDNNGWDGKGHHYYQRCNSNSEDTLCRRLMNHDESILTKGISTFEREENMKDARFATLSDEIGVIRNPSMNLSHQLFLYLVHFYLVLLLVVSLPATHSTYILISRRKKQRQFEQQQKLEHCKFQQQQPTIQLNKESNNNNGVSIPKSLSYYL